jgi:hypothetical protein
MWIVCWDPADLGFICPFCFFSLDLKQRGVVRIFPHSCRHALLPHQETGVIITQNIKSLHYGCPD